VSQEIFSIAIERYKMEGEYSDGIVLHSFLSQMRFFRKE